MWVGIVTAVKNGMPWIRAACASVWSQRGVNVRHRIVDGASQDGTVEWLAHHLGPPRAWTTPPPGFESAVEVSWESQPDMGLYDALNRGFDALDADVLGWLNADEQYLPETLEFARRWFEDHPERDLLFGDFLLLDADGRPCARRRVIPVRWPYVLASHLYGHSCAMFFRRRVWTAGFRFDQSFRVAGDADWVVRVLRAGFREGVASRPLAAFRLGSGRLSETPVVEEENRRIRANAPRSMRALSGVVNHMRRTEQAIRGAWRSTPSLETDLWWPGLRVARVSFEALQLPARWPARMPQGSSAATANRRRVRYASWKQGAVRALELFGGLGARLARHRSTNSPMAEKVVILEPFRLGDAVLVARMALELRTRRPELSVCTLTHPSSRELLAQLVPDLETIAWAFPWTSAPGPRQGWIATLRFLRSLRTRGFDVGIDPRGDVRSQLALCLVGCRRRIGLTRYLASNIQLRGSLLTDRVEVPDGAHRMELHARLLEALGIPDVDCTRPVAPLKEPGRTVVLCPGAGWQFRQWSDLRWAELASRLTHDGCEVRLIGSPESQAVLNRIRQLSDPEPIVRTTSLEEFLQELQRAAVVISPDSVAVHLASEWYGVPVVALFGPGVVSLYRPRSRGSVVLHHQDRFPCAPCTQRRCVRPCDPCMLSISVEEVLSAVRAILGGTA